MTTQGRLRAIVLCVCLATYWSASGLLRLHEVFYHASAPVSAVAEVSGTPQTTANDRAFGRLVVVLIDALRADMVMGSDVMYGRDSAHVEEAKRQQELNAYMPYTRNLLASGQAMSFIAHASVPTVTMPRLKALLTGKAPAFIDILKNFNSVALSEENLMQLFQENGDRIVFYGDDTWLKLFPETFQRSDGTSGFFTRDTVEVDDNVTRHLRDELDPLMQHPKSQDWDVLVLHYLGLDHVGHLRGPRSSMMKDKLEEMDAIVQLVQESVYQQDQLRQQTAEDTFQPTLILLCSDHGMSEVGNHGGATVEESSALMAFMRGDQKPWGGSDAEPRAVRRQQVDLVPTLASLFGLRIPMYSTGVIIDDIVEASTDDRHHIASWFANFQQLRRLALLTTRSSTDIKTAYQALEAQVSAYLSQSETSDTAGLLQELRSACQDLQERVGQSNGSEYNTPLIALGAILLLLCAGLSITVLLQSKKSGQSKTKPLGSVTAVAIGGALMQIISLSSSSSIENEHATAFFTVTTLLLAILVSVLRTAALSGLRQQLGGIFVVGALLVCNRVLRGRNQVINFGRLNGLAVDSSLPGNAFANDDSISILSTSTLFSQFKAEVFYAIILVCSVWKAASRWRMRSVATGSTKLFVLIAVFTSGIVSSGVCSHLAHEENAQCVLSGFLSADDAARIVYGSALVLVVLGVVFYRDGPLFFSALELALWQLVSLVQREENTPTLAVLSIQSLLLCYLFRQAVIPNSSVATMLNVLFAFGAFFALGNSHLVTTVDISQSYHGLSGYSQGIVGILTFVNVFSGHLLSLSSCYDWIQTCSHRKSSSDDAPVVSSAATLLGYQAARMAVYTIVVYFMRFHLFIWSVFAPKMLYEVMFTIVVALFALMWTFVKSVEK
ncbi:hypothetical protein Poli38472_005483 [Pythium oligandrum]|uniref:GPI ethanolamine phosphate transferase 2 C-terminal domain-containing protein n=1 Tax=Pythium oligandrum TaxID=41045 RepID=A0A8K1FGK4_PYTOL|nr:hypothetical protein Poli38472_005483 [Pythium oligandrum]|eukprot:TMW62865.1 hypothetical protein Poli38472_005483 [Pythium oligandrum]